ncbi:MAG TPA: polyphosphate kinase 1 [Solirubrobacteraceae bacterium]|nr:polyphosphate kinase 1 [Solirubrobacteraceae bacterium]
MNEPPLNEADAARFLPTAEDPFPAPRESLDLADAELSFNREVSWADFNDRVLQLAEDSAQPLLERAKFAAIFTSNLDEFFMIRVAGLHDQVEAGITEKRRAGLNPAETIDTLRARVQPQMERQARMVDEDLRPALAEHGIRIIGLDEVPGDQRPALGERFKRQVLPVLTPLAVGLGRPFPYISNLSLSLAVLVRDPETDQTVFARVKVPKEMLPRFVPVVEGEQTAFVLLEDLIAENLSALFPGMQILDHGLFRVTRDADFEISDEADDLLEAVEAELRRRPFGEVVRLEVQDGISTAIREQLVEALRVEERQVYAIPGLLDMNDLWQIAGLPGHPDLRDEPWTPVTAPRAAVAEADEHDMFSVIRQGDLLVHHPYESFHTSVERFVTQAVEDPDVLAVKQTVYRTSDDSPLVPSLITATERGKQAVCLVELKARFDEQANIQWGRRLEESGVHVVYGLPGMKTHAKCLLVVRREGDGVRRYVHIGTGNYHPKTARLYTDFGLFTCDDRLGADVADMFNFLTGYGRPTRYREVLMAPNFMLDGIVERVHRVIAAHEAGEHARIRMKMNALVHPRVIEALYAASTAGVPVELNVRGICCLVPGIPGVSENIRVVSILGRFLEHSRIYTFEYGSETDVLIGSADLMPRNLDNRVELIAPVRDPACRGELLDTIDRCMADNTHSWDLRRDGTWVRNVPAEGEEPRDVQRELLALAARRAAEVAAA